MVSLDKSHANTLFSGDSNTMAISQPLRFDRAASGHTDSELDGRVSSEKDMFSPRRKDSETKAQVDSFNSSETRVGGVS